MEADGNTYATRGFSYGRLGDFKAQIRDYDAAIEIQPDTGVLYAYRARAYEKAGNLEAAARDNAKAKSLGLHAGHFDQEQLKE